MNHLFLWYQQNDTYNRYLVYIYTHFVPWILGIGGWCDQWVGLRVLLPCSDAPPKTRLGRAVRGDTVIPSQQIAPFMSRNCNKRSGGQALDEDLPQNPSMVCWRFQEFVNCSLPHMTCDMFLVRSPTSPPWEGPNIRTFKKASFKHQEHMTEKLDLFVEMYWCTCHMFLLTKKTRFVFG